ncbi:MAG: metallopeptidase family protein [Chloroflexi bacterium]|nr:metallopeptidase family protein [Chloroflexota bacterium]
MTRSRQERIDRLQSRRGRRVSEVERFDRYVSQALEALPRRFRDRLENVAIVVEEWPPAGLASRHGADEAYGLLGLYEGTPYGYRADYHLRPPDRITLYRGPILAQCRTRKDVVREVRETLLHEIGHYFGLGDSDLH